MKASLLLGPSFLAGVLVACGGATTGGGGGGANGGNTVSGTVNGVTLTASSAIAALGSSSTAGTCAVESDGGIGDCNPATYVQEVSLVFTNRADVTCSAIQALAAQNVEFANIEYLSIGVNVNGGIVPGTYDVVAGQTNGAVTGAFGGLSGTNATCVETPNLAATGGTVTITAFDGSHVAGSYEVTFGAKGSASGSFNQSICAVPEGTSSTGAPVCR